MEQEEPLLEVRFAPGQVCHTGFHVRDVAPAERFFQEALGWRVVRSGQGPSLYSLLFDTRRIGCGAIGTLGGPMGEPGVLPYVAVGDVLHAVETIRDQGGTTVSEPVDIPGRGRFVLFVPPGGPMFGAWMSTIDLGDAPAYHHERTVGAFVGRPVACNDPEPCARFFRDVFGWGVSEREGPDGTSWYWDDHGGDGGTFYHTPSRSGRMWVENHVLVEDLEKALARAEEAGGRRAGREVRVGDHGRKHDVEVPTGPRVQFWEDGAQRGVQA